MDVKRGRLRCQKEINYQVSGREVRRNTLESKKEVLTEKFTKQRSEELCDMYLSHSIVGTGAFVKDCDGLDSLLRLERQTKSIRSATRKLEKDMKR
jgi:hypothetical protein